MASKQLPFFEAFGTVAITLGGLPSSTTGVGQQGTIIDNSTTRYKRVNIFGKVTLGTTPTVGAVYIFAIKGEKTGTAFRTDGAGPTDAGFTVLNARLLDTYATKASPATGDVINIACTFEDPGPEWTIAVVHTTGVNLNATNGNHVIEYRGEELEAQ
jgi:hypothetical protein